MSENGMAFPVIVLESQVSIMLQHHEIFGLDYQWYQIRYSTVYDSLIIYTYYVGKLSYQRSALLLNNLYSLIEMFVKPVVVKYCK